LLRENVIYTPFRRDPSGTSRRPASSAAVTTPSISVVVPVYNGEQFIGETLTAILSQTHPASEVIVVDDGSTDGTPRELTRFAGMLRVIRQANRGQAAAQNTGFGEARGDYVARCDADDIWEPFKLERQIEVLGLHPQIDIACTAARRFGLEERLHASPPGQGVLDRRQFARLLYQGNPICASSTLIRHRLFEEVGPFRHRLPSKAHDGWLWEDYDYWLRALATGAVFFYDPTVLVYYRQHERQATSDRLRAFRADRFIHQCHADLIDDRRLVRAVHADDLLSIGRQLADDGRHREARRAFRRSLRYASATRLYACARSMTWMVILSLPTGARRQLSQALINLSRAVHRVRRGRHPESP
jgi:glycosyltransferase involved in cell wall biosynthesis